LAAGSNFALKIAAKSLQISIATWLLLTAYRNSSSLYPTVPPPAPYDVWFSHNACVTDDDIQQTDRQTDHTVGEKAFADD